MPILVKRSKPPGEQKPGQKFWHPYPPNRGANATRREVVPTIRGRTCEAEQSGIKATRCLFHKEIGELRQVTQGNVLGWARVQATSHGVMGTRPNQHKRAVPRRGHGAKSLTQHRHAGHSANSGSVDTVPEPSGCTPLSLSSCDRRQAALSASGCECSLPEMAMKTCKKVLVPQPTQPWHQATRKEAARNLQGRT